MKKKLDLSWSVQHSQQLLISWKKSRSFWPAGFSQGRRWLCTLDALDQTVWNAKGHRIARLQIYQDSVLDLLSGLELTLMAGNQEPMLAETAGKFTKMSGRYPRDL